MRSGRLLFLDEGNALGTRAIPISLETDIDRVTSLVEFREALETRHYEMSVIRADWKHLFGDFGEGFRRDLLNTAQQFGVMTAVMVRSMRAADCEKLIREGFDDVIHEPRHVSQFESQLRSLRRIALMRRELNRRQDTLREFLAIVEDSDLDLFFDQEEENRNTADEEIILLDLDPAKSGAISLYPELKERRTIYYFDELLQAQERVFLGNSGMTIINSVGHSEEALSLIASMRASATLYNHPVLLVVRSAERPPSAQVFAAGASDYLEGDVSVEDVMASLQSLLRHEQLRNQLATQCDRPTEAIVHDNLTGFYSYGFGLAHLRNFEKAMKQHNLPLTVAVISLDNLRRINDEFGYAAGDAVIRQVSTIIHNCVRGEDLVVRVSGAKFLLLFPESELAQARIAMNRINSILQYSSLMLPSGGHVVQVATSFRIAGWTVGDSLFTLILNREPLASQAA